MRRDPPRLDLSVLLQRQSSSPARPNKDTPRGGGRCCLEFDEVSVEGLVREIIDKAIACDEINAKIEDGPNTLEQLDALRGA